MTCCGGPKANYRLLYKLRPILTTSHQFRAFHASINLASGHNRWSTIRHDKAKNDASKNRQRSVFAQEIATASKLFGSDPNSNPRLFDLIAKAKKSGFAKQSIEAAIARGQGKSPTGAALESAIVEAILPGNIGLLVDCETDNKARTLQDLRTVIKKHNGSHSPSTYLFNKHGRITFEASENIGEDEIMVPALEAGALDVWAGTDGVVLVLTEPAATRSVGEAISKALDLQIASSEIVWTPTQENTMSLTDSEHVVDLLKLSDDLHEADSSVRGVYMNVVQGSVDQDLWNELGAKIN